jgi:hypothetical protein
LYNRADPFLCKLTRQKSCPKVLKNKNVKQTGISMKQDFNRHGAKISDADYQARIIAAHGGAGQNPSKEQDSILRRAELDAHIDHNLGVDFPAVRREKMWDVAEEIERERWSIPSLSLGAAFKAVLFKRDLTPNDESWGLMAGYVVRKYKAVLDAEEIEAFLPLKRDGITAKP